MKNINSHQIVWITKPVVEGVKGMAFRVEGDFAACHALFETLKQSPLVDEVRMSNTGR